MKNTMSKSLFSVLPVVLASLLAGCAPAEAPDTRAADEKAIQELEVAWSKTAGEKNLDAFISYYADDAVALAPNTPIATGPAAIKVEIGKMFAMPGFALSFAGTKVAVARNGDLAYSVGTYSMTVNDPKGAPMTDKGKYMTVFRKNAEGKWKVVGDMFNSDLPMPAPPGK